MTYEHAMDLLLGAEGFCAAIFLTLWLEARSRAALYTRLWQELQDLRRAQRARERAQREYHSNNWKVN